MYYIIYKSVKGGIWRDWRDSVTRVIAKTHILERFSLHIFGFLDFLSKYPVFLFLAIQMVIHYSSID